MRTFTRGTDICRFVFTLHTIDVLDTPVAPSPDPSSILQVKWTCAESARQPSADAGSVSGVSDSSSVVARGKSKKYFFSSTTAVGSGGGFRTGDDPRAGGGLGSSGGPATKPIHADLEGYSFSIAIPMHRSSSASMYATQLEANFCFVVTEGTRRAVGGGGTWKTAAGGSGRRGSLSTEVGPVTGGTHSDDRSPPGAGGGPRLFQFGLMLDRLAERHVSRWISEGRTSGETQPISITRDVDAAIRVSLTVVCEFTSLSELISTPVGLRQRLAGSDEKNLRRALRDILKERWKADRGVARTKRKLLVVHQAAVTNEGELQCQTANDAIFRLAGDFEHSHTINRWRDRDLELRFESINIEDKVRLLRQRCEGIQRHVARVEADKNVVSQELGAQIATLEAQVQQLEQQNAEKTTKKSVAGRDEKTHAAVGMNVDKNNAEDSQEHGEHRFRDAASDGGSSFDADAHHDGTSSVVSGGMHWQETRLYEDETTKPFSGLMCGFSM